MKTKQISREKYIDTFCRDIRIRDRQVLYVSAETHTKMKLIAHLFRDQHVTTASLIDTILRHHIEAYRALLEEIREEQYIKFIGGSKPENNDDE